MFKITHIKSVLAETSQFQVDNERFINKKGTFEFQKTSCYKCKF